MFFNLIFSFIKFKLDYLQLRTKNISSLFFALHVCLIVACSWLVEHHAAMDYIQNSSYLN